MYSYGGVTSSSAYAQTLYATNTGFQSLLPQTHVDVSIGIVPGDGAVLSNGNIIMMVGCHLSSSYAADVWISTNYGASFSQSTNAVLMVGDMRVNYFACSLY